jgi:hypothetical protein
MDHPWGLLQPTGDDFAMLRLVLLALLPQIGRILLMVGRVQAGNAPDRPNKMNVPAAVGARSPTKNAQGGDPLTPIVHHDVMPVGQFVPRYL